MKEKKVRITGFNHQGEGMCRISGKVTFVPNTIPGEEVVVCVSKEKTKYNEGKLVTILDASDKRITPICPYYGECGGCDLMHFNYEEQLIFKQNTIRDIIKRFYRKDVLIQDIIPSIPLSYRNKGMFKIVGNQFGYYKNNTNEFVRIDKCLLMHNKINEFLEKLDRTLLTNSTELIVRSSNTNEDMLVALKSKNISLVYLTSNEYILNKIGDYVFKVSATSFFQINDDAVEKLYAKISSYASLTKEDRLLDLYCGTGTIGIYLSKQAKEVVGIEINKQAIIDARDNQKLNNISNISFICNDGLNTITDTNFDVIVVDPPREGIRKDTLDILLNMGAKRIVYVSCNPITLCRDLDILDSKYEVIEITPVDMFPNTHHVECATLLIHK